ncbi:MAG: 16S rRNA (guanine(527)-N(7))-methyltransferase RsmG [Acetobacteraceae bacterium]
MDAAARIRLDRFVETLLRWNAAINLIARGGAASVWQRHVEDSLQLGAFLQPMPQRLTDLGAGGGFPGLVLSIAFGVPVDLIEEDQRKCAFLREAARITGAPATVHAVRIEAARIAPAPVVTARALAPVPRLLAYAAPLLLPDGACWFLKGREVDAELAEAERSWVFQEERRQSRTDPGGVVLRISGLRRR